MNGATCETTTTVNAPPGVPIDCSGIDVRLRGSGVILVDSGAFILLARNLTVDQGRRIEALPDPDKKVGIEISLTGSLQLAGKLIAENAGRGSFIAVDADGNIELTDNNPAIITRGSTKSADGGELYLSSGGSVFVGKLIEAHGKEGLDDYNISSGGTVHIFAVGDVAINHEIQAHGHWLGGGRVQIISGGSISINDTPNVTALKGKIKAEGRGLISHGGFVELVAGNSVLVSGQIYLPGGINHGGGESAGGALSISSGCGGITIEDPIDLTGGSAGGGVLVAEAQGPITLLNTIEAQSRKLGGDGGVVLMTSENLLQVTGQLAVSVNGHNTSTVDEDGEGGLILLAGCQVFINDTSDPATSPVLTATGAIGGAMSFEGSKSPLASTEVSLRVGDRATIDATGEVNGALFLEVTERRIGRCSYTQNVQCTQNADCPAAGCSNPNHCTNPLPNPDTDGVLTQFHPAPIIEQQVGLVPCSTICN